MVAVAFLASGCATGVPYATMASSIPVLKAGEGRMYFLRSNSMLGAAVQPEIRLNESVVGRSQPGGFFYVDRPSGKYLAAASTEVEKTLSLALDPGEVKYIRSSPAFGLLIGRIILDLETPEKARQELTGLTYTGTAANSAAAGHQAPAPEPTAADATYIAPKTAPTVVRVATVAATTVPVGANLIPEGQPSPRDDNTVIQRIEFRSGASSITVERLATQYGCIGGRGAGLITDKGPVEVYRMSCDNGVVFLAKCELRQCQQLR